MRSIADDRLDILRLMLVSRLLDERCGRLLEAGTALPHYHSGVGQEALMVAPVVGLRANDKMIYTHRGYGHLLAKGIPVEKILLDLFMKRGGTNDGLGGVMHVNDPNLGVWGREGVFGTRFGLAAGFGLADKLRSRDDVTVCFYGEAAGARGILYEALNMCRLWSLPVVFIAENNGWSFTSRTEWLYPEGRMSGAWSGFVPVEVVDGNDVDALRVATDAAVARARRGDGPSLIEGLTYRMDPHIWYDPADYQPAEEIERWRERDPIAMYRGRLLDAGLPEAMLDETRRSAEQEVQDAFDLVDRAPDATRSDVEKWLART